MSLGERLRHVRKKILNITQVKFAEPLGISNAYISDIEKDKAYPSEPIIQLIELHHKINRDYLKTGEGPMFLDQGKPPPSPANPGVATTQLECRNEDYSTLWIAKEILEQSPLRDKLEEEIKKFYRELTARTESASNA